MSVEAWLGYVTQVNPLRVRRDYPTAAAPPEEPISLVSGLKVGDKVYLQMHANKLTVMGRVAGRPSWQSWTPTFEGSDINPTMGNSTRVGRYIVDDYGTVTFSSTIILGSSFAPGNGAYMLPLPVPANVSGGLEWSVNFHLVGSSPAGSDGEAIGYGKIESGVRVDRMFFRRNDSTANSLERVDATVSWEAGNRLTVSGSYERA